MLHDALEEYGKKDIYPFHMPGHKRKALSDINPYETDITEIHGFDDLHEPEGLIRELEEEIAGIYGAERAYISVNGSTAGNLAAMHAAICGGECLLMGRNSHKSVYHGAFLLEAETLYLYPEDGKVLSPDREYVKYRERGAIGRQPEKALYPGKILPGDVEKAFSERPDIKAAVITSPTYEGVVSDTKTIAKICHSHDALLIIDSAHGAHLGFHPYFPESEVKSGADAVIMSFHKTLPMLTQTAVLLLPPGSRLDTGKVRRYMDIFQTSSPSYVLMGSISRGIDLLKRDGKKLYEEYAENLKDFYRGARELKNLSVDQPTEDRDPSKIIMDLRKSGISGPEGMELLRERYHIETEMAGTDHILAMSSVCDEKKDLERLLSALKDRDHSLPEKIGEKSERPAVRGKGQKKYISEAVTGEISERFISIYPPGIPIIVPGEKYTPEIISGINTAIEKGLRVTGL